MEKPVEVSKIMQIFNDLGLNKKDSMVYFELLKQGPKGMTVNGLNHAVDLPRTTIYSILNKLSEMECIKEGGKAWGAGRQATNYIANKFSYFINILIDNKEKELNHLIEIKDEHSDYFDHIYRSGYEYTIEDVDAEFRPYIKPLLEKGWKISSFDTKVWDEYFEYKVYDCMLMIPYAKYIKDRNSIHLFEFKYDIEHEKNALKSMINNLKKRTKEIIGYETGISKFELQNTEFTFLGRTSSGIVLKTKVKEFKKSKFFSEMLPLIENLEDFDDIELWRSVIMPYNNKVFFVWAESLELIGEMFDSINSVEKITQN
ncbi:MAG: helix-turn-helix domain-containing protein [Promethearchaeota archaeon]